jgi:hypothetical protein
MEKETRIRKAMLIAHNNTHSTSRIFRNLELIKNQGVSDDIQKRLNAIEDACTECRKQVDDLYTLLTSTQNQ